MAFKEVNALDADRTVSLTAKDKKTNKFTTNQVEGYYLGSKKVASKKAKSGFSWLHYFNDADGNIAVWGKTDMDRKVLNIPLGTMSRISRAGMVPTPNGDMYKFKVELDETNVTTNVPSQSAQALATEDTDVHYDDDAKDEAADEAQEDDYDAPPPRTRTLDEVMASRRATTRK